MYPTYRLSILTMVWSIMQKILLGRNELSRIYMDVSHVGEFDWGWQMSTLSDQRKKWIIPSNDVFTIGLQQSFGITMFL